MKTIESKLNFFLSEEELELLSSSKYEPLIRRILEVENDESYTPHIEKLCEQIAGLDYLQSENKYLGIYYHPKKNRYVAEKTINGEYFFIKSCKSFKDCEKAFLEFCREKNINPYKNKYS